MAEIKLNITHYKILAIVYQLNKLGKYPNAQGVYKLLAGIKDKESEKFTNLVGFSSLISASPKKISFKILGLTRHGFLANKYDPKTDKLYLEITTKGSIIMSKYLSKKHSSFDPKNPTSEVTIVDIEN